MLMFFSDSRDSMFAFATEIKPVIALIAAFYAFVKRKEVQLENNILLPFGLFFIITFISIFFSPQISVSFQKTLSLFLTYFSIPVLLLLVIKEEKEEFLRDFIWIIFSLVGIGIVLNYINPEFTNLVGRHRGLLGNPNGLGIFLGLSYILFNLVKNHYDNFFTGKQVLFITAVFVFALILCESRAAMMMFLIYHALYYAYNKAPVLGWIMFFFMFFYYSDILEMIPKVTSFFGFGEDLRVRNVNEIKEGSGRFIAWAFAWETIQDQYVWGKGVGYTEIIFKKNYSMLSIMGHQGNAHNSYLTFWLDTGAVGMILYFVGFFKIFLTSSRFCRVAMPAMFAILFSINYESWLTASLSPFIFIFIVIITLLSSDLLVSKKEEVEADLIPLDL